MLLAGSCGGESEDAFCSDLRHIERALEPLREARERGESSAVAARLIDDVITAYESVDPPAELRLDWVQVIGFFEHLRAGAESFRDGQPPPKASETDDAARQAAASSVTDYAVEHCGATRGKLFP